MAEDLYGRSQRPILAVSWSTISRRRLERHRRSPAAALKELGHLDFEPVPVISKAQIIALAVGDA